jgi:hypothetical protein
MSLDATKCASFETATGALVFVVERYLILLSLDGLFIVLLVGHFKIDQIDIHIASMCVVLNIMLGNDIWVVVDAVAQVEPVGFLLLHFKFRSNMGRRRRGFAVDVWCMRRKETLLMAIRHPDNGQISG